MLARNVHRLPSQLVTILSLVSVSALFIIYITLVRRKNTSAIQTGREATNKSFDLQDFLGRQGNFLPGSPVPFAMPKLALAHALSRREQR